MPLPSDAIGHERHAPLSMYVQAYMEREGLSARQFAARAVDPEGDNQRLLVQWVLYLADNQLSRKAPELWRLRALAAAMATDPDTGLDRERYRRELDTVKKLAAAQWFEMTEVLDVPVSDGSIVTVSVPPSLSDEDREKIRRWAEQMAKDLAHDR